MGTSAVVMLVIGALFLWGGFLLAAAAYWRSSRREAAEGRAGGDVPLSGDGQHGPG